MPQDGSGRKRKALLGDRGLRFFRDTALRLRSLIACGVARGLGTPLPALLMGRCGRVRAKEIGHCGRIGGSASGGGLNA